MCSGFYRNLSGRKVRDLDIFIFVIDLSARSKNIKQRELIREGNITITTEYCSKKEKGMLTMLLDGRK